jgi:SHS2 domain-containing protein
VLIDNSYRFLEHVADMGIEARAGSRAEVFQGMARGLVVLIFGDSPAVATASAKIAVRAEDPVELLVGWLNEVAYWCEKNDMVPSAFTIDALSDNELQAAIFGEPFTPERHAVERQVKSVTYHQACLEETPEGWYARVYVDL